MRVTDWLYGSGGGSGTRPAELVPVAEGLYEPSGCVRSGMISMSPQRNVLTRLTDTDGDGFFETQHDVGTGWEGWNYHQFTFGLEHRDGKLYAAATTAMAPPGWEGQGTNATVNGPMRGGLVEVDLATETTRVVAGGLRTPNTVAGARQRPVLRRQPGHLVPASVLTHVQPGRFYGHFNHTNLVPKLAERFPDRRLTPACLATSCAAGRSSTCRTTSSSTRRASRC